MTTYYIYALIDPRTHQPFYIGKGCGARAQSHLNNTDRSDNKYKESKIRSIRQDGLEPIIEYLLTDIGDELLAYQFETAFILKYGRKGYESYGILTNICIDSRPPSHKGKTYEQIYGITRAQQQKEMRAKLQKERGGYGPKKHSEHTINLMKEQNIGESNPNASGLTTDDMLAEGKKFCDHFQNKISNKKWQYWCKHYNIPKNRRSYRFDIDLFSVFQTKFGAEIVNDSLQWYYNPHTNKNWRCFDWELEWITVPDGFVRGRGKVKK
jgi:hypothetical protein